MDTAVVAGVYSGAWSVVAEERDSFDTMLPRGDHVFQSIHTSQ